MDEKEELETEVEESPESGKRSLMYAAIAIVIIAVIAILLLKPAENTATEVPSGMATEAASDQTGYPMTLGAE